MVFFSFSFSQRKMDKFHAGHRFRINLCATWSRLVFFHHAVSISVFLFPVNMVISKLHLSCMFPGDLAWLVRVCVLLCLVLFLLQPGRRPGLEPMAFWAPALCGQCALSLVNVPALSTCHSANSFFPCFLFLLLHPHTPQPVLWQL